MRQMTLSNRADPAAFEDEAELITDLITDRTMKTEPFTAAHEVTRIGSEGYTVETCLVGRSTIGSFLSRRCGGQASKSAAPAEIGSVPCSK